MKKILLACDGTHFSGSAFDFARQLNDLRPILLTGVFIPQLSYANLWSYANGMTGSLVIPLLESDDMAGVHKNMDQFRHLCEKHDIEYKLHQDFGDMALPELRKETRFADLLIIGSDVFYKDIFAEDSHDYIKEVLHTAECPVIVIPHNFQFPAVNILTYDGSESSVFAIKQFAYLFPELTKQETVIVYISEDNDQEIPNRERIEELVHQHFMDVDFIKLDLDPKKYFSTWENNNRNAILVSGSFGRSFVSELFRKSFLNDIIDENRLPVFIAHK